MNGQLPPVDQDLRAHLVRRSAGPLPEGLAAQVLQAVDAAPVKPRYAWRAFSLRSAFAAPRRLTAGASLAAVVLLVAALAVVPRFQMTPAASGLAGYPADRALTTAELASLMAGPALPTNTALVAKVTIDPTTDVCPNERYKTLGMVDGMSPQICVMGTYNAFDAYDSQTTATFAFRYLAPGYLGLLGAIVSPPELGAGSTSKLAFRASEQWPSDQSDKPFLVEGWLGSSSPPEAVGSYGIACAQPLFDVGDPLDPTGPDNTCKTTWLADDPSTVPSWEIADGRLVVSVQSGHEVGAGGARVYDSIPNDSRVKGIYVVRSEASAVSCALPSCGKWVVMAKVADISLPQATATPPVSLAGYPAGRALTAAELAALMAHPALPVDTALVASVTIDANTDVCWMDRYPTIGLVEGMGAQVCVMGAGVSTYLSTPKAAGIFAFRYLGPGVLGLIGEITPASSANTAFRVADEWPLQGKTFLVDGWLGAEGLTESCALPPTPGEILLPDGEDCPYDDWLGDDSTAPGIQADHEYSPPSPLPSYDPLSLRGNARHVEAGGMRIIDSVDHAAPVHGVYVVRSVTEGCPGDSPQSSRGCGAWRVLAEVAEVSVPAPSGTPLEVATAAPTTAPPATPVPPSLTGVIGAGNQPLSVDELETLMVTQPDHLAGRTVIVEAPIPTQISCQSDASGGGCAVNTKPLAGDGVWAVSIGADGTLSLVGEVTVPESGFVFPLGQAVATWSKAGTEKQFFVVDAWIGGAGEVECDVVGSPCYEVSWLGSTAAARDVDVQYGAYHMFGGGAVGGGAAIHGVFLVEWVPASTDCGTGQDTGSCTGLAHAEVLARVETASVP